MLIDKDLIFDKVLGEVIGAATTYANDLGGAMMNAGRDMVESMLTGRRTLDEWAQIAGKAVDEIKKTYIEDKGWEYVGGKIHFTMSPNNPKKVVISIELYCQDENEQWQRVTAASDMFASNYTKEALADIRSNGKISYEAE